MEGNLVPEDACHGLNSLRGSSQCRTGHESNGRYNNWPDNIYFNAFVGFTVNCSRTGWHYAKFKHQNIKLDHLRWLVSKCTDIMDQIRVCVDVACRAVASVEKVVPLSGTRLANTLAASMRMPLLLNVCRQERIARPGQTSGNAPKGEGRGLRGHSYLA